MPSPASRANPAVSSRRSACQTPSVSAARSRSTASRSRKAASASLAISRRSSAWTAVSVTTGAGTGEPSSEDTSCGWDPKSAGSSSGVASSSRSDRTSSRHESPTAKARRRGRRPPSPVSSSPTNVACAPRSAAAVANQAWSAGAAPSGANALRAPSSQRANASAWPPLRTLGRAVVTHDATSVAAQSPARHALDAPSASAKRAEATSTAYASSDGSAAVRASPNACTTGASVMRRHPGAHARSRSRCAGTTRSLTRRRCARNLARLRAPHALRSPPRRP